MKFIKKSDALKAFEEELSIADKNTLRAVDYIKAVATRIYNLPEYIIPHGYWRNYGTPPYRCSECGYKSNKKTPYCPVCGANMQEDNYETY